MIPSDELAIRNRYAAYCFAADDRDPKAMADCFTERATVEVVGQSSLEGREAIAGVQETPSTNRHLTLNLWLTSVCEDQARGRSYFLMLDRTGSVIALGRYTDEIIRETDGEWRFSRRKIAYEWQEGGYRSFVDGLLGNEDRERP